MIEYAGIYQKKQKAECARILNVSDAGFWSYDILINNSSKTQEKEAPQGNILEFFPLRYSKTTF